MTMIMTMIITMMIQIIIKTINILALILLIFVLIIFPHLAISHGESYVNENVYLIQKNFYKLIENIPPTLVYIILLSICIMYCKQLFRDKKTSDILLILSIIIIYFNLKLLYSILLLESQISFIFFDIILEIPLTIKIEFFHYMLQDYIFHYYPEIEPNTEKFNHLAEFLHDRINYQKLHTMNAKEMQEYAQGLILDSKRYNDPSRRYYAAFVSFGILVYMIYRWI